MVDVFEVNPLAAAVIPLVPAATPVTTPVELFTVAWEGVPEVHTGEGHGAVDESE